MARGNIYEMSMDIDNVGDVTESNFYEMAGIACEFVEDANAETENEKLVQIFKQYGAETGVEEDFDGNMRPYIIFTEEVKINYFKSSFEKFKKLAESCSLEEFSTTSLYNLRFSILDPYGECVYINDTLYEFEQFLRESLTHKKYYLGNVVWMN